jgi:hypothetical protein
MKLQLMLEEGEMTGHDWFIIDTGKGPVFGDE